MRAERKGSLKRGVELIVAATLGALALLTFALHVRWSSVPLNARETALFSILEFLLTLGFGWFSTRAISRNEFENSLKQFAVSAYRRIADIERMLTRLQYETRQAAKAEPALESHLRSIEAVVADTSQLVRSSIADWTDVIGEELLTLEQIARLEHERAELRFELSTQHARPDAETRLRRINQEFSYLVSRLPRLMRIERPKPARPTDKDVAEWIAREHHRYEGFELTIVTGDLYRQERHHESLQAGELVRLVRAAEHSGDAIDAVDSGGAVIGRMQNLSPVSYEEFVAGLEKCYGGFPLSARVVEVNEPEQREDGYYCWVEVKVAREPAIEDE
jgi:hypothetical protein